MTETWVDIPGYEDKYQVSDYGRIKSKSRIIRLVNKAGNPMGRRSTERLLKPSKASGNSTVGLYKNRQLNSVPIKYLVAEAFLQRPTGYNYVIHLDDNIKDNHSINLEWCRKRTYETKVAKLHRQGYLARRHPVCLYKHDDKRTFPSVADSARWLIKNGRTSSIKLSSVKTFLRHALSNHIRAYGYHAEYILPFAKGQEIWQNIPNSDGMYQASSNGRIRTTPYLLNKNGLVIKRGGKIFTPFRVNNLQTVQLDTHEYVHYLVAETFVYKPKHCHIVKHLDGDVDNNSMTNLAWCDDNAVEAGGLEHD